MSKEETFPIPLQYIDVAWSTHTDLDVMQEKRMDDYWNVDSHRSLSDSWTGFTKFTLPKENFLKEYLWSGGRLTKVQATAVPDTMCDLKYGSKLGKPLRREKSKSGLTRSQNSIMLNE